MRTLLATAAVVVVGITTLWFGTDGFRAFTAEGARRLAVQQQPRDVPVAQLQDQKGERFSLSDYEGKLVLVQFIYTRCPALCTVLGANFQSIQHALPAEALERKIRLLSISFDRRDRIVELKDYARRYRADAHVWRVARLADEGQLRPLLEAFGVVVIPNTFGGFEHNAAIHLVDRHGRLAAIFDYDMPAAVSEHVRGLM